MTDWSHYSYLRNYCQGRSQPVFAECIRIPTTELAIRFLLAHVINCFHPIQESLKTPGFGVGMPIARALVQGQNGSKTIENQVGFGTTLTLDLPVGV